MPKQAKKERDKEGSSASFNLFLSGEATLVWTWISGEGKGGSHSGQNSLSGQPSSWQMPPPSFHLQAQSISEWHFKLQLWMSAWKDTVQKHFPAVGQAPCLWLWIGLSVALGSWTDKPGISVQLAARWAGTAWPFWICQGRRREAGASCTRSGKANNPPASWSSCRLTAAQTLDSQGLTYISTQHQQQVPVCFCSQRPAKCGQDKKRGQRREQ